MLLYQRLNISNTYNMYKSRSLFKCAHNWKRKMIRKKLKICTDLLHMCSFEYTFQCAELLFTNIKPFSAAPTQIFHHVFKPTELKLFNVRKYSTPSFTYLHENTENNIGKHFHRVKVTVLIFVCPMHTTCIFVNLTEMTQT